MRSQRLDWIGKTNGQYEYNNVILLLWKIDSIMKIVVVPTREM